MSMHDTKPEVKVEEIKDERPYPGPNGTFIHPNDMGIIKTAPDDIKPASLDLLFGSDSPPRAKHELPLTPPRSPSTSPGPSRPALNGRQPSRKKVAAMEHKPMMVDDLPQAWDEAHATFTALDKCVYETKGLGLSRESDDMMVCDCVYEKRNPGATQCGPQSDCVNRAIFIECLSAECRAKDQCRNQRFSKQQYATLDIVQTEKKGFGLRATHDLAAGSLVYEYIGEVVAEKTFRKRMQQYADEGIRHFYFMMLQKEEYIDATKKGGIGRFANHSCNPNSEVQKWVVGRRLRMGIFTKQDVVKGEEITFNYNVDRYGHDAQICYCGEPNCVGTIGGKTQTDIGGMGDLLIQALGIADDVESMEMKGSKKRKARQLDEIDYIPILKPIPDPETAQKVAAAMRQTMENKRVLSYLLQRIKITDDIVVQRQLIRMHGFSLMSMILTDLADDASLVTAALEAMMQWKLQEKNKVEDSGIQESVQNFAEDPNSQISSSARRLLDYWSTLTTSYRIARKPKIASLAEEDDAATTTIAEADSAPPSSYVERRRTDAWENEVSVNFNLAPVRRAAPIPTFARPRPPPPPPIALKTPSNSAVSERSRLDAIIASARQSASTPTRTPVRAGTNSPSASSPRPSSSAPSPPRPVEEIWAEEERLRKQEREREREKRKRRQQAAAASSSSERDDKRAKKLIGDVVVPIMSKYKHKMERDQFKRFAQQCTELLMEKEKKGKDYGRFCRLTTLPDEKRKKIQNFANDYTVRLLKKMDDKVKSKQTGQDGSEANGNGSTSHEPSMTPGDSFVVATPEMHGSTDRTPANDASEENYGESDLEMDLDMDAELEDHTFSVVKDKLES